MTDILNKTIVLVLNRNWQAINIRTPKRRFAKWQRTLRPRWRLTVRITSVP